MSKFQKILLGIVTLIAVASLFAVANVSIKQENLGGTFSTVAKDYSEGISIDGVSVISGDREITGKEKTQSVSSAIALTTADSGKTIIIDTTGAAYTLPPVASSNGVSFKFVVGSAFTTNAVITSAEGDNVEGALIVAGAVVDCDDNDVITFVADGENLGDFVEVLSNGTNWYVGASGALTTAKLTCSG